MENFVKYVKTITGNPILPKKSGMTTAILMPEMNTTEGIYRSVLPSYIFTGSKNLRMLIIGLTAKTGISNNDKDYFITKELIAETDHFVFPFVSYPLEPTIKIIRDTAQKIGKKNPIIISYYIDFNYYLVPDSYPYSREYKQPKMVDIIEQNIRAVDQVIVTNKTLKGYIADKMKEKYLEEAINTRVIYQPLFILPELTKTAYRNAPEPGKTKILLIGDECHFSDFNHVKGILKDFQEKYKKSEIDIIGWDGRHNDKNFLVDLKFQHWPRVEYNKYFETICHIGPDVIVIPSKTSKFEATSKNYIKYLEASIMGIPVIAPDIDPYRELIENNRNGFLAKDKEDYLFQFETLVSDPDKFKGSQDFAYTTASLDYNISDKQNIKLLTDIYFPGYEGE